MKGFVADPTLIGGAWHVGEAGSRSAATEHFIDCGRSARWSQTGSHVIFDCNGYTIYEVDIEGDRLTGQWHHNPKLPKQLNMAGQQFSTCLVRNP